MSGSSLMNVFGKLEDFSLGSAVATKAFLGKENTLTKVANPIHSLYLDPQEEEAQNLQQNIAGIEAGRAATEKTNLAAETDKRALTEEDRKKRLRRSVSIYTSGMGDMSKANVKRGVLLGA